MSNVDHSDQLPTVLSLCTGYGGIERGLELAGFEHRTVAHVEIEAFAAANLVAKMEEGQLVPAAIWTDLKTLPAHCFRERIDVLTGGYPCQPFSAAGLRKGTEDPRHLWPFIKRHIETIRPLCCFFENVEGHISLGLREVIADLESLGYTATWGIFSAAEVGAPHQRKRVYILAVANGFRLEKYGHSEPDNAVKSGQMADTGSESGRGGAIHPRARNEGRQASAARREGVSPRDGQALADHAQSGGEDVPNANFQRLQGRVQRGRADEEGRQEQKVRPSAKRGDQWSGHGRGSGAAVSGLGRGFNGPATWLDGSWEVGVERVTSSQNLSVERLRLRVDRLRLLGNGVVPQTAALAWIVLNDELASE